MVRAIEPRSESKGQVFLAFGLGPAVLGFLAIFLDKRDLILEAFREWSAIKQRL